MSGVQDDVFLKKMGSSSDLTEMAFKLTDALYLELSLHPKPGLITPVSVNSHDDMDFYVMFETVPIIREYLLGIIELCDDIFYPEDEGTPAVPEGTHYSDEQLMNFYFKRLIDEIERFVHFGVICEKKMFSKTGGVNTYKGIIFTYSIMMISLYIFLEIFEYRSNENDDFPYNLAMYTNIKTYAYILQCTGRYFSEYKTESGQLNEDSYGAKAFAKYKYRGVLEEAAKGYSVLFDGINYFLNLRGRTGASAFVLNKTPFSTKRFLLCKLFLFCANSIMDTNILGKTEFKIFNRFMEQVDVLLHCEDQQAFWKGMNRLNAYCMKNDISPGGSADLFAAVIGLLKIFNLL